MIVSLDMKSEKRVIEKKETKTFTDRVRLWTKPIIEPIVRFLAKYHVSPNSLTVLGLVTHFLFAWLIGQGRLQLAGVLILFLGPLDALDGALARALGHEKGGFGAYLDSTIDRIAEIVLFGGFIYYYSEVDPDFRLQLLSYVALTGSLMVSYSRARAEALGLSCKVGFATRVERYGILVLSLMINIPVIGLIMLGVGSWVTVGQRGWHVWRKMNQAGEGE